jgi:Domain of unknown function DUF29
VGTQPPGHRTRWRRTMRHARREIAKRALGSLRGSPTQYPATTSRHGIEHGVDETGLPLATFPEVCPSLVEQVLGAEFWPEDQP